MQPTRTATAQNKLQAFQESVLYRFGTSRTLDYDNGRQYVSKMFQSLARAHGKHHRFTPPYTPHANPVEHANKEIGPFRLMFVNNTPKSKVTCSTPRTRAA